VCGSALRVPDRSISFVQQDELVEFLLPTDKGSGSRQKVHACGRGGQESRSGRLGCPSLGR
jgi:hypothetical protein